MQRMFPECRLLHDEPNTFKRIAVIERCIIIIGMVVWIGKMIVTRIFQYPRNDSHRIGHFL
jgi:hypothetical protein